MMNRPDCRSHARQAAGRAGNGQNIDLDWCPKQGRDQQWAFGHRGYMYTKVFCFSGGDVAPIAALHAQADEEAG